MLFRVPLASSSSRRWLAKNSQRLARMPTFRQGTLSHATYMYHHTHAVLYGCRPSVHRSVFHSCTGSLRSVTVCLVPPPALPPISISILHSARLAKDILDKYLTGSGVRGWRWAAKLSRMRHPPRRPSACGTLAKLVACVFHCSDPAQAEDVPGQRHEL